MIQLKPEQKAYLKETLIQLCGKSLRPANILEYIHDNRFQIPYNKFLNDNLKELKSGQKQVANKSRDIKRSKKSR